MSTIGERIKEERERLTLSQTAFGEIGGVKKQAQLKYERGDRSPDAEYLAQISTFGVDVLYVLTGNRHENTATTPLELSYLRLCRAMPDVAAKNAGNAALLGVLASYGIRLVDTYPTPANDQQQVAAQNNVNEFKVESENAKPKRKL